MRVVIFEAGSSSLWPLADTKPVYDLYFGSKRVSGVLLSKFNGLKVDFSSRWSPRIEFGSDDILLYNSLALNADTWLEAALNGLVRGDWHEEMGMVEGKSLVFAFVDKKYVRAVSSFLRGELDEQKVGAITQKVMPLRATRTIYDELIKKGEPKILITYPWEFLSAGLRSEGSDKVYTSPDTVLDGSEIFPQSVVLGKTRVKNSRVKNSIIVGPALIEDADIEDSYIGSHVEIKNSKVSGYVGDYSTVKADVIGKVRVGTGSTVLEPLEKDLPALSVWEKGDRNTALANALNVYERTGGLIDSRLKERLLSLVIDK